LILPTAIPWERLKGRDLEETLYWLLAALGGKNLTWRKGGKGAGAPDQGRDLEVEFSAVDSAGVMAVQKWWVEAKGRGADATVERFAVQQAVHDAWAREDLDCLVVATNTTFSNPTRDWVKEWATSKPRPAIQLWDRSELERLLASQPEVAIRMFAEALSPQGRLEVIRSRFWNYATYAGVQSLEQAWSARDALEWDPQSFLAVVVSEARDGDFVTRRWATVIPKEQILDVLELGLGNVGYFCLRAGDVGTEQAPYFRGLALLLLAAISRFPVEDITPVFARLMAEWEAKTIPGHAQSVLIREFLGPMFGELNGQLRDVCASDCKRVLMDRMFLGREELDEYWLRLRPERPEAKSRPNTTLILEEEAVDCKVGFPTVDEGCPLVAFKRADVGADQLEDLVEMLWIVVRSRFGEMKSDG
jgi:hypothetical protein